MHEIQLQEAFLETGIPASMLNDSQRNALFELLRRKCRVDVTATSPWDTTEGPEGKRRTDGWSLICDYVGMASCLFFLEGASRIWEIASGDDLRRLLEVCPPLEFYVCNREADYLLCHNHHDYVIGWGGAGAWVESLDEND